VTAPRDRPRIAVPASGRLRDVTLEVLSTAGYDLSGLRGRGSTTRTGGFELIEMRPRDAAASLAAGTLDGAFVATDIALEHGIEHLARLRLGAARSTLVIAARDTDGPASVTDLDGAVVATHMPVITTRFLVDAGVEARVLTMGGSL
jgi:ATP phosphoribosyltransferase